MTSITNNNNSSNNNKITTPPPPPVSSLTKILTDEKRTTITTLVDKEACGDYILIDIIGKGGFGVVYKGLHKTKGHFSAIKKIKITKRKKGDKTAESQSMLMVEINLLKVLSHHNIVRYYDHIPTTSHSYIVMEFIENGSLEKIVKRHGLLPEGLVNVYIAQVLSGLEYLHRQGVIHRDIKAANLLISTDGSIKLADFGVATKVSDLSADNPDDSFAGTPYWMAPEIIQMQGVSTACDVWSLGCTIIELLTGTPPYFGLAPAAALYKIVQEDHPPIPQGISPALKDFLLQCFKKDENMRSSAKQLLNHPWIKAIVNRNLDNTHQVKNARQEIISYNTQLQEVTSTLDQQPSTRPRSKQPPVPNGQQQQQQSGNYQEQQQQQQQQQHQHQQQQQHQQQKVVQQQGSGQSKSWIQSNSTKDATSRTINAGLTLASPRTNNNNSNTRNTVEDSNHHNNVNDKEKERKAQLTRQLSRFIESDNDDDNFGDIIIKKQQQPVRQPLKLQQNKQQQQQKQVVKQKLEKFADEEGDDDFGSGPANGQQLKMGNSGSSDWDDKGGFDGFSDDDENDQDGNSQPLNLSSLKLKLPSNNEEWDSEIEDTFDSISQWTETDNDVQTTINLQDKQREQITKTIVDIISQLNHYHNSNNTASSETGSLLEKLMELLDRFPDERRLLVSNGEFGVYFRLPIIMFLEMLDQPNSPHHHITLKLINQAMSESSSIMETICILNGIPIITQFASRNYPEQLREEVSIFVLHLCKSSSYSLNMFIAGSRGCRVLVDLVDSDYFNSSTLIHNTLDSISQVFKLHSTLPKTSLCHLFARTQLLNRISLLLHQIFIPTATLTTGSSGDTNKNGAGGAEHHRHSSSVQKLSKDAFERVLSYSVKAADILLFFSTGDALAKEELSSETVMKSIRGVLGEICTWTTIGNDVRAFLLRVLKVIKNLSMDQHNRIKLDNVDMIPTLIGFLGLSPNGIDKITEIYNQVLHSLYHLLLLDKARQDKALKCGILPPLHYIINSRGPLKELALPILFDLVRLSSSSSRIQLWECNTLDKLLELLEDRNWFADAIESIAAWASLESTPVFERLTNELKPSQLLIHIVHTSHIKHPSFSKSLIPLLHLMQSSPVLTERLIEVGLVNSLIECLELDNSSVSKITLLKIVGTVLQKNSNQTSLKPILQRISKQDESEIVKTIADSLLSFFSN
ncbi:putative protein serine/threonine kinase [Heterostelium album PN500]|uniref:non-specific serine/threonine protein kinase n=1 Tax=Heterostelium pallidum (strain ATCC 26659 / Pp 5 / PN500) TaxID=670386 RepID=D3BAE9_HETP5|nr:putative protein serine/threonine kinase [Heterostelium album PN500]EFA81536.1 putative protein serine/threonine kinase [Heterostelium album PN500]|eukprot:XP_020433653.1 putative protein serine/threonine kinase [Heterostelium album PN500]